MGLQEQHNILNLFLFNPALLNLIDSFRSDARNFGQTVRRVVKHIKRLFTESLDDSASVHRANAFNQAAPQIFLNPVYRRRQGLLTFLETELLPVLRIILPETVEIKHRANMGFRHHADGSNDVRIALGRDFDYRVTVLVVVVCDSFNDAVYFFHDVKEYDTLKSTNMTLALFYLAMLLFQQIHPKILVV